MKVLKLSTLSLVSFGTAIAHAEEPEFMQPGFDWSGWYGGLNAGAALLDGDMSVAGFGAVTAKSMDDTSATAGVQIGHNWQDGDTVFGIEADINYLDLEDNLAFINKGAGNLRAEYDWFATVRGRLAKENGDSIFYVTGGAAFLDSELTINEGGAMNPTYVSSDILTGWTAGLGFETKYNEDTTFKIEYLYADFDSDSVTAVIPVGAVGTADPDLHIFRIGVNKKLN